MSDWPAERPALAGDRWLIDGLCRFRGYGLVMHAPTSTDTDGGLFDDWDDLLAASRQRPATFLSDS